MSTQSDPTSAGKGQTDKFRPGCAVLRGLFVHLGMSPLLEKVALWEPG